MPVSRPSTNPMSTQQLSTVLSARQFAQRVQDKLDAQFLTEVWDKSTRVMTGAGPMHCAMGCSSVCASPMCQPVMICGM